MHRLQINDTISECSTRPTNWKWFMSPLKTSLLTFSQSRLLDSALNWTDQELECGKYHVICFKIDQRWSPHFVAFPCICFLLKGSTPYLFLLFLYYYAYGLRGSVVFQSFWEQNFPLENHTKYIRCCSFVPLVENVDVALPLVPFSLSVLLFLR